MNLLDNEINEIEVRKSDFRVRLTRNGKRRDLLEVEVTEDIVREFFISNENYLVDIWKGYIHSERHEEFKRDIKSRHALYFRMISDPFTETHIGWFLGEISKVFFTVMSSF